VSLPAPNFLKVEGHDGLYRDPTTGAIVNRDKSGFQAYMDSVKQSRDREAKVDRVAEELNTLKNEMSEIKGLLVQLLNKDK